MLTNDIDFKFIIPIILVSASSSLETFNTAIHIGVRIATFLLLTAIFTVLIYILVPWLIIKVGRIWKGQSKLSDMQKIMGMAQIPALLILLVQLIKICFGKISSPNEINYTVQFIVWLFSCRILIIGIARAQKFNYGLALLNIVLLSIPFFLLLLIIR